MAMLFYIEPNTTTTSSLEGYHEQVLMKPQIEASFADESNQMLHYMLNYPPPPSSEFFESNSLIGCCREMRDEGAKTEGNSTFKWGENVEKRAKNKRKRAASKKTSEQAESQRMTHIAVERNRRKQMNEHLNILRSIMPNSYVQRVILALNYHSKSTYILPKVVTSCHDDRVIKLP